MYRFPRLELIVFLSGAAVMSLEITGSRVVAPYLGTSLFVWTALISVILIALGVGYFLGGTLADRELNGRRLSVVLAAGSLLVLSSAVLHPPLLRWLALHIRDLRLGAFLAALLLFAPPAVLLGIVPPYAMRLRISKIEHVGRRIGLFSALSTFGSILGTVITGFFLLSWFGTIEILACIAGVLLACSLIVARSPKAVVVIVLFMGGLVLLPSTSAPGYADIDTGYNRIWIKDGVASEGLTRFLITDPLGYQSAMLIEKPDEVIYDVAKAFRLAEHFRPAATRALAIGGAAYIQPRDFLARNSSARIVVVELDPGVTDLARKYFALRDDPRFRIVHEDGRIFLNRNTEKFQVVFVDAFGGGLSIPFQLTSKEALTRIARSLDDDGVVLANVISAGRGSGARLIESMVRTYREVFPMVRVFALRDLPAEQIQNFLVLGLKRDSMLSLESDDQFFKDLLGRCVEPKSDREPMVLSDNFGPVDALLSPVLQLSARNRWIGR